MLLNLKTVRSIDTVPVALYFCHIDGPFLRVKEAYSRRDIWFTANQFTWCGKSIGYVEFSVK